MKIIEGKKIADEICKEISEETSSLKKKPTLAVILIGDDPASKIYVNNKIKKCNDVGIKSIEIRLPNETTEKELIDKIIELNKNSEVNGILVQLPLPTHINEQKVINTILPEKDVDGFHTINKGKLLVGQNSMIPCTPLGCLIMLKKELGNLSGKNAVIVGRSNIVGKPMALLLLQENCTVTIAHSKTENLAEICRNADILIAAVGKTKIITKDYVKNNAVVIDVGINRDKNKKLCGDVDFEDIKDIVSAITPVPGGVGPMTIACLLKNTLSAFKIQNG